MPKKPFSLRSVPGTHIKYAKKMKKFDREVLPHPKSRKSVFSVRDSLSVLSPKNRSVHKSQKKNMFFRRTSGRAAAAKRSSKLTTPLTTPAK